MGFNRLQWLMAVILGTTVVAHAAPEQVPTASLAAVGRGPFRGYGGAAVMAKSHELPTAGVSWRDVEGRKEATLGSLMVVAKVLPASWDAVQNDLPKGSTYTIRALIWNGVSAWLVDCEPTDGRQWRVLVAPGTFGFLTLAFAFPAAELAELRPQMEKLALAVRFVPHGLHATYHGNMTLDAPKRRQVDPRIDFDWGEARPNQAVKKDTISVQWTGFLWPQFSETYTFTTRSDDGVRLWIGDELVIENWTDHSPTEDHGKLALVGGKSYPIKLEWYDNLIFAVAELSWQSKSQAREIIPAASYTCTPPIGFLRPSQNVIGGGDKALPRLLREGRPGGYQVTKPVGLRWEGRAPKQTLRLGQGDAATEAKLRWVSMDAGEASQLLRSAGLADMGAVRSVLWRGVAAWSVEFKANIPSDRPFRRIYLVPLGRGVVELSFAAKIADWRTMNRDAFVAVLDSVNFIDEAHNFEPTPLF